MRLTTHDETYPNGMSTVWIGANKPPQHDAATLDTLLEPNPGWKQKNY